MKKDMKNLPEGMIADRDNIFYFKYFFVSLYKYFEFNNKYFTIKQLKK